MSDGLISVGLDVGTTTTQVIFSKLAVENQAGSFSVPEMAITRREILYSGAIHFTPLLQGDLVDAAQLRKIIDGEYQKAGIAKEAVNTGAIIITGETSRKENAEAVLHELSGYAGEFVVAAAGPDLESILAAKGAGADVYAERTGKTVLHMDIGGGTSNLARIRDGKIVETGCLNVGGRLIKFDASGEITYVSPVLQGICPMRIGQMVQKPQLEELAQILVSVLEMAAGLREPTQLLEKLTTEGTVVIPPGEDVVLSFSGGVADCISREVPWKEFGDLGPVLGRAIRKSRLCSGSYILGEQTIRATVIGAGCHSAQLSGSTVFHRNIRFPLKNLPVMTFSSGVSQEEGVIAISEGVSGYGQILELAERLAASHRGAIFVCMEQDMAKALGQALALRLPEQTPILCIDRVKLSEGSYLDVGEPVGPALPVVVKTLVLSR